MALPLVRNYYDEYEVATLTLTRRQVAFIAVLLAAQGKPSYVGRPRSHRLLQRDLEIGHEFYELNRYYQEKYKRAWKGRLYSDLADWFGLQDTRTVKRAIVRHDAWLAALRSPSSEKAPV
jgi:hypothetical protein